MKNYKDKGVAFKKARWIENPSCQQETTPVFKTKVILKATKNAVDLFGR